jgi:diguanylate cyclase (GGDEF)-like protein
VADNDYDPRATVHTGTSALPAAAQKVDASTACLVVIYGADLGKRIPLDKPELTCGRSMQTDIPLDDDAVSRKHARFFWTGGAFTVNDLGSTNGTFVNDASVRERTLRDGDQVKIGHTIFKLIAGGNIEASYHEEIYRLMTFDGLTQALNKRAYQAAIEREISRCQRYQRPLALALFDIDHFKKINDELGHLAGDAVLRQLASLVMANVRREDTLARVGGEEFALILPELELGAAYTVAEKLRAIVARTPMRFDEQPIALTASFGCAALALAPPMVAEELYKIADERLYAAKRGGRNRVVAS